MNSEKIPLRVEIQRMLELLARQIYQSPLALLRENCQNAYDAILERQALGQIFEPGIDIVITPDVITVNDNGIGMTREQLVANYWTAGSSGKNTPEARAAGVVGTFGIGAMANFGIADKLEVRTRSATGLEGLYSTARRDELSASEDCIELAPADVADIGTLVSAHIADPGTINVGEAEQYISEFVQFLPIPVLVNGTCVSRKDFNSFVTAPSNAADVFGLNEAPLSDHMSSDIEVMFSSSGEVWLRLTNIKYSERALTGEVILKQGLAQIRAFRSRFALSSVGVASAYNFGGIANLANLEPTAGREALTTDSMQFIQSAVSTMDSYISGIIAPTDFADKNSGFQSWVIQHGRYELCSRLMITLVPTDESITLDALRAQSHERTFNYYEGSDRTIRDAYATDETPLIVPASANPRRQCQTNFIRSYCRTTHVQESPQVLSVKPRAEQTLSESALAFRLAEILESDYFVSAEIRFGRMSHNLPLLVDTTNGIRITLDATSGNILTILELYEREFPIFTGVVKDFVRSTIFAKIQNLVPSSTRAGAEAFLNAIRRPREYVEYDMAEADALRTILGEYYEGRLSFGEAAARASETARVNYQVLTVAETRPATAVIGDVIENERRLAQDADADADQDLSAYPAITRMSLESGARLLTIGDDEQPLRSYRLFVAVADRVQRENAEFFLQPHKTEVVWGGQKVLYIFQHHSGTFALYYEMQSNELFAEGSGGGAFPTCTIVIKNQVYIPVLEPLRRKFMPTIAARKRFAVRSDLLFPDIT